MSTSHSPSAPDIANQEEVSSISSSLTDRWLSSWTNSAPESSWNLDHASTWCQLTSLNSQREDQSRKRLCSSRVPSPQLSMFSWIMSWDSLPTHRPWTTAVSTGKRSRLWTNRSSTLFQRVESSMPEKPQVKKYLWFNQVHKFTSINRF